MNILINGALLLAIIICIIPKPISWTLKKAAPIFAFILCALCIGFAVQKSQGQELRVTAVDRKNEKSEATEIWLKQVILDGRSYSADNVFSGGWLSEDGFLKWRSYDSDAGNRRTISGIVQAKDTITLVFDACKWRGIVDVDIADEHYSLDTYDPSDESGTNTVSIDLPGKALSFHVEGTAMLSVLIGVLTLLGGFFTILQKRKQKRNANGSSLHLQETKKREVWLDVLKVVSAFFIVQIHAVGDGYSAAFGTDRWNAFLVLNMIPRFAVATFMMVSGVLLLGREIPLKEAVKKAATTVVLLLFWNIVFLTAHSILWGSFDDFTEKFISIPVKRQFSGHLWYIYFMVWMYLFSPILGKLYRTLSLKQKLYIIAITLVLPGLLDLYSNAFDLGGAEILPSWYLYMSFSYAGLMMLGRLIYDEIYKLERAGLWGFILIVLGLGGLVLVTSIYSKAHGIASNHFLGENKLFPVLYSAGIFILAANYRDVWNRLSVLPRKLFVFLSKRSLGMYLFHPIVLWSLSDYSTFSKRAESAWAALLCCTMTFIISAYCVAMMSKIPFLKKTVM